MTIVEYTSPPEPKYKIGDSEEGLLATALLLGTRSSSSSSSSRREFRKQSSKVDIQIEGSAILKRELDTDKLFEEDKYYDLQIDRLVTS